MAIHVSRIRSVKAEQTRLPQRQSDLAAGGGKIGKLPERLGLLECDDELLPAVFLGTKRQLRATTHFSSNVTTQASCFVPESPNGQRGVNTARNPDGARASRDGRTQVAAVERKVDTRRKIQLGGLITKAGFAEEELAVLLGMLTASARVLNAPNAI